MISTYNELKNYLIFCTFFCIKRSSSCMYFLHMEHTSVCSSHDSNAQQPPVAHSCHSTALFVFVDLPTVRIWLMQPSRLSHCVLILVFPVDLGLGQDLNQTEVWNFCLFLFFFLPAPAPPLQRCTRSHGLSFCGVLALTPMPGHVSSLEMVERQSSHS